jgi:YidC/Oxa1 family membrane protein insertase
MSELFNTLVYEPLYNTLILILSLGTWVDVGVAVIVLTVLVKSLLFPVSLKAARQQQLMRQIEGPMKEIREKYKNNKEEQGRKLLELYKEKGVNPFTSIGLIFIQLPIIIGLYLVFARGGLPDVHAEFLYTWVHAPENIRMLFVGLVDMAGKSMPLAVLAGITQYFQAKLSLPTLEPRKTDATFQDDFARSMQINMKYMFPFMIAGFAYMFNAAVALYWITSNIFAIGQEIMVKKQLAQSQNVDKKA